MNMRASACASATTGRARARLGSTPRGIRGRPPSFFLPPNTFSPQPLTRTVKFVGRILSGRALRDVPAPQVFEVERRRPAVATDVRDAASGPDHAGAHLESLGHADGFDDDVGAEPLGEVVDQLSGFLGRARRRIRAQRTRGGQPGFGKVDGDDSPGL
ncbi:hypothetical protein GCM10009647_003520 [Streptomyces sanglieri]